MRFFQTVIAYAAVAAVALQGSSMSADEISVPKNAKVRLSTQRETFFLGENVLIHFELVNTGGKAFEAGFGGDYRGAARSLRFKVTGKDQAGKALADPYPSDDCLGGLGGPAEITPETPFAQSLPLCRYLRIEAPGTYTITVGHDFGWKLKPGETLPTATIELKFKQPTEDQADELVEKWLAAEKHNGSLIGTKSQEYADFSQIKNPAYLPALIKHARLGNKEAVVGLGSIPHRDATAELIKLSEAELASPDRDPKTPRSNALGQLCQRLPDPKLTGELGSRNPFEMDILASRKWLVDNSWHDDFANDVGQLAKQLLVQPETGLVATGAYLIECVGTATDATEVVEALNREVAKTRTLDLEKGIYPRPRGACAELGRAALMMIRRGYNVPANPTNEGEAIFFCIALKTPLDKQWRPEGWLKTVDRLLKDQTPYVVENALKSVPKPLPQELRHHLGSLIAADDVDVAIEACRIVGKEKLHEFKKPVLEKLKIAREDWLFRSADGAALSLGLDEERLRILISRLDEKEMLFPCLDAMKTLFSNTGGGGSNSNIDVVAAAKRIKPLWEKFLEQNAEKIRAGHKFELPDPAITRDMFPEQYTITLRNGGDPGKPQSWPERR